MAKATDTHPRWYRVAEVDLLSQFDSPSDDVVPCIYEVFNWSDVDASSQDYFV